jgi:hypothetical protein
MYSTHIYINRKPVFDKADSKITPVRLQQPPKQLPPRDSPLADQSCKGILYIIEINDSDESSFGFYGKDKQPQISQWFGTGTNVRPVLQKSST